MTTLVDKGVYQNSRKEKRYLLDSSNICSLNQTIKLKCGIGGPSYFVVTSKSIKNLAVVRLGQLRESNHFYEAQACKDLLGPCQILMMKLFVKTFNSF